MLIVFFIAILSVFCCQNDSKTSTVKPPVLAEKPLDGTAKMVHRLQQANANINPMKINYFTNHFRDEKLKNDVKNAPNISAKMNAMANAAYEEIKVSNS